MKLAADIVEHKGPGQRRNRNRLAFLAADQAALEDIQNVVRKKLAWASIVRDARGILQLPPAQEDDAKKKLHEQETAALNAVRRGWKHLLLPQEPHPSSPNVARGFDLEPVALTNRGSDPAPLAQLACKKCEEDGLIVARLGVLDNDLGKVWQPTQPHVAVRQLRDWFAQFPYLSKLREPQVLAKAISEGVGALRRGARCRGSLRRSQGRVCRLKLHSPYGLVTHLIIIIRIIYVIGSAVVLYVVFRY
jgi:hypothetical protein